MTRTLPDSSSPPPTKKLTRSPWVWGALVILLVAASWWILTRVLSARSDSDAPSVSRALPVSTIVVEESDGWTVRRELTGEIVARRSADLSFDRTARLVEIRVDDGDEVVEGQLLARLDARRLEARQEDLVAQRSEHAARLEEMRAGPRAETIAAAHAQVDEAKAEVAFLDLQTERRRRLAEDGTISSESYDETRFQAKAARAREASAQKNLDELLAGTRNEQIRAQEAVVERLEARLREIAIELEDGQLVAPFSGTVTDRRADEGALARAGEPVVRLVEHAHLEARIGIPLALVQGLAAGDVLEVLAGDERWPARVRGFLPEIDRSTQTRGVILTLESTTAIPGQIARLPVEEPVSARGVWLPISSLRDSVRGLWSCLRLVEREGRLTTERCDVEILHTEGLRAFVRAPLQAGDRVVADAQHRVVPGQLVESVPAPADRE